MPITALKDRCKRIAARLEVMKYIQFVKFGVVGASNTLVFLGVSGARGGSVGPPRRNRSAMQCAGNAHPIQRAVPLRRLAQVVELTFARQFIIIVFEFTGSHS